MPDYAERVEVHLYDVSRGLASRLSPVIVGKEVEGLWHSGVVVGGVEYNYGPSLWRSFAGQSQYGEPDRVINIGTTLLNSAQREEILRNLTSSRFNAASYNTLFNNGNHFAQELSTLLTGSGLPDDVLVQIQDLVASPLGEQLLTLLAPSHYPAARPEAPPSDPDAPSSSAHPAGSSTPGDVPMKTDDGDDDDAEDQPMEDGGDGRTSSQQDAAATFALLQDIMDNLLNEQGGGHGHPFVRVCGPWGGFARGPFGMGMRACGPAAGGCGRGGDGLGPVGGCGRRFRGRGSGPCSGGRCGRGGAPADDKAKADGAGTADLNPNAAASGAAEKPAPAENAAVPQTEAEAEAEGPTAPAPAADLAPSNEPHSDMDITATGEEADGATVAPIAAGIEGGLGQAVTSELAAMTIEPEAAPAGTVGAAGTVGGVSAAAASAAAAGGGGRAAVADSHEADTVVQGERWEVLRPEDVAGAHMIADDSDRRN